MTASSLAELSRELFATRHRLEACAGETQAARPPVAASLARFVGRIGSRLIRPPRIVLLGEFNSGKSTLANALIGAQVLPTSIHANTSVPIHIHYSTEPALAFEDQDRVRRPLNVASLGALRAGKARFLHVGLPVERLRRFEVIDTPGLASGHGRLDELVVDACRRSHIATWCTVATQAWKATEASTWAGLPARLRRRGVLAVTQTDGLNCERDRQRLEGRLCAEAAEKFAGYAMVNALEADAVSRDEGAADHADRWSLCGGKTLLDTLEGLIDAELAARRSAAERVLRRAASRFGVGHDAEPVGTLLPMPMAVPMPAAFAA